MKTKTLLLAGLLVASTAAFADAGHTMKPQAHKSGGGEKFYARLEGGLALPRAKSGSRKIKAKNSMVFGAGIGYIVNDLFRTDLTLGYRDYKPKTKSNVDAGTKTYSAMINGYLEAHNPTIVTPYLLGGIGMGFAKTKHTNDRSYTNQIGIWNLGVGARASVANSADVDLTYRYVSLAYAKEDSVKSTLAGHEFLAGVMFRF